MKINQKYTSFQEEFDSGVNYLNQSGNANRLEVKASILEQLNEHQTAVNDAYHLYKNVITHTESTILGMKKKYNKAEPYWRAVKKMLKYNIGITLTADDIAALHIHVDSTHRTEIKAVKFSPNNQVIKQTHLVTRIFTNNPTQGREEDKSKPEGVNKIGRAIAMVNMGEPEPEANKYDTIPSIGSVLYNLTFKTEDMNKQGYLVTWYISPTGEESPRSKPVKFTII